VRGDLWEWRDPTSFADLVDSIHDRHQYALSHAVLVARTPAVGREHELVEGGWLALDAPRVQLLHQVKAEVDLPDARCRR
jgi:hypothetical protein